MGILTFICCFIINGHFCAVFLPAQPQLQMVQITCMWLLSAYPHLLAPSYSTDVHLSFSLANDSTFLATITYLNWIKSFHTRRSTLDQSNILIISAGAEGCCHIEKVVFMKRAWLCVRGAMADKAEGMFFLLYCVNSEFQSGSDRLNPAELVK